MYIPKEIAARIKEQAKGRISIKKLLENCDLGVNTISELAKGKQISYVSLAKIADELNCSVDYLLGRTNIPKEKGITDMIMDLDEEQLRQLLSYTEFLKAQQDAKKQKKD